MTDYLCPFCNRPTSENVTHESDEYKPPVWWVTRWGRDPECTTPHALRFEREVEDGRFSRRETRYGIVLDRVCQGCPDYYPACGPQDVAMPHSICEARRREASRE